MSMRGAASAARISPDLFRWCFGWTTLSIGTLAGIIFLVLPEIDLRVADTFYLGERRFRFSGHQHGFVGVIRWFFIYLYFSCLGLAIAGVVLSHRRRIWAGFGSRCWMFLAACLVIGPGLVANVMLKDQTGRARPKHVAEFGGEKAFTPPLVFSRECRRGCSFVSGEASSIFAVFYAAALAIPQWSILLAVVGTAGGAAAGLIRMSQGAHFLSDVIFAGVFMALTVHALHELIFGQSRLWSAIASSWQPRRTRA